MARLPGSGPFSHLLGCTSGWLQGLEALSGDAKGDAILAGRAVTLLHRLWSILAAVVPEERLSSGKVTSGWQRNRKWIQVHSALCTFWHAAEAAGTAVTPRPARWLLLFSAGEEEEKPQTLFKRKPGDTCLHHHCGQTLEQPEVQIQGIPVTVCPGAGLLSTICRGRMDWGKWVQG